MYQTETQKNLRHMWFGRSTKLACVLSGLLIAAGLQIAGAATAPAGLLAYEGFDYPARSGIAGQSGGLGWSNSWMDVSGNLGEAVSSGGLVAGGNAPAGYGHRATRSSSATTAAVAAGWIVRQPVRLRRQAS